jgi:hypothetical protein
VKANFPLLALALLALGAAAVLLALAIRSLIGTVRSSAVASIPLQAEQRFALPRAGEYELYGEGQFLSRDFGALEFSLHDVEGRGIPLEPVYFRTKVASFSRVRLQLRSFEVAAAGSYVLRVRGIREGQDAASRIVIATPVTGRIVLHVLAMVGLGLVLLASLGGAIALGIGALRR